MTLKYYSETKEYVAPRVENEGITTIFSEAENGDKVVLFEGQQPQLKEFLESFDAANPGVVMNYIHPIFGGRGRTLADIIQMYVEYGETQIRNDAVGALISILGLKGGEYKLVKLGPFTEIQAVKN